MVGFGVFDGFVDQVYGLFGAEVGGLDEWDEFSFGKVAESFGRFWAGGSVGEGAEEIKSFSWVGRIGLDDSREGGFLGFEVGVVGVEVVDFEVVIETFEPVFDVADGVEPVGGVGEDFSCLCPFVD